MFTNYYGEGRKALLLEQEGCVVEVRVADPYRPPNIGTRSPYTGVLFARIGHDFFGDRRFWRQLATIHLGWKWEEGAEQPFDEEASLAAAQAWVEENRERVDLACKDLREEWLARTPDPWRGKECPSR